MILNKISFGIVLKYSLEVIKGKEMTMSELDEFLSSTINRQIKAEEAIRVTHIYRREDGEWKIVHRHGDVLPIDQSPPAGTSAT